MPPHRRQPEVRLRVAAVEGCCGRSRGRPTSYHVDRNLRQAEGGSHSGHVGNLHGKKTLFTAVFLKVRSVDHLWTANSINSISPWHFTEYIAFCCTNLFKNGVMESVAFMWLSKPETLITNFWEYNLIARHFLCVFLERRRNPRWFDWRSDKTWALRCSGNSTKEALKLLRQVHHRWQPGRDPTARYSTHTSTCCLRSVSSYLT